MSSPGLLVVLRKSWKIFCILHTWFKSRVTKFLHLSHLFSLLIVLENFQVCIILKYRVKDCGIPVCVCVWWMFVCGCVCMHDATLVILRPAIMSKAQIGKAHFSSKVMLGAIGTSNTCHQACDLELAVNVCAMLTKWSEYESLAGRR